MIRNAPEPSQLLAIWEDGAGKRTGTRAIIMLRGALPDVAERELTSLPVGRRDSSLLDLRERLFGSRFTGVTSCPSCAEELELTFEATEVRRKLPQADGVTLSVDGVDVELRLPNGGDLVAIETAGNIDEARRVLLSRCLVRAAREGRDISVDDLPAAIVARGVARLAELDPQADVSLDVQCVSCGLAWLEPFDVVSYLWSDVNAWVRRLLSDVHIIASAYGWSERDILSLTPERRGAYLALLQ